MQSIGKREPTSALVELWCSKFSMVSLNNLKEIITDFTLSMAETLVRGSPYHFAGHARHLSAAPMLRVRPLTRFWAVLNWRDCALLKMLA
jgi:hypothetical protein